MTVKDKRYTAVQAFAPNTPVRILHIIKSLGRGGAETLLPETLSKHDKTKYQFHYIYFLPWKDQMVSAIRQEGGDVTCMPAKNNIGILLQAKKIAAYVNKHEIQLIHCHLPWAGIIGRIVGKFTKVPVVYTEHNTWDHYHKLTYHINKLTFSIQQKVIAVSHDVAKSIKAHYGREVPSVQVVLNGINTEKFSRSVPLERDIREELSISGDKIVIGIVCVFRLQKRLDVWLDIASKLQEKHPHTAFLIVGDGPFKEDIHQKAKTLQVKNLHFAGLQSEIRPYLKAMDIFMMSSEFEGLPIALLEAMSMGCVPACTAAGGIPELIHHGSNGMLVPVDKPMQLVEELSSCIEDRQNLKVTGELARESVIKRFSVHQMVNKLEEIYDSLIK